MKRSLCLLLISAFAICTALAYATVRLRDNSNNDIYQPVSPEGQRVTTGVTPFYQNALTTTVLNPRSNPHEDDAPWLIDAVPALLHRGYGEEGQKSFYYGTAISRIGESFCTEFSPWINSKGEVVWQGWDGWDYEIFLYDGSDTTQLTNNSYDDVGPQINDRGWIAWRQFDGEDYEIFIYDGSMIRQLTNNSYSENGLQLNDSAQLVWWAETDGTNREIFFYNGSAITRIASNSTSDGAPKLNANGDVVWNAGGEIFFYDGSNIEQITNHSWGSYSTSRDTKANKDALSRQYQRERFEASLGASLLHSPSRPIRGWLDDYYSVLLENGNEVWRGVWMDGTEVVPAISGAVLERPIQVTFLNSGEGLLGETDDGITSGFHRYVKKDENPGEPEGSKEESPENTTERLPAGKREELNEKSKENTVEWHVIRKIGSSILKYSRKYNVDPALVLAIINAESEFEHPSISRKGAIGLMQLMPQTADQLGIDPFDIEENIKGGIKHLSFLLSNFDSVELAVAAYNAGSANVKKHKGIPPFKETKRYVRKVLAYYKGKES